MPTAAPAPLHPRTAFILAAAAAIAAFQIWLAWTGYIQSDDANYISNAIAWATRGPVLVRSHWGLRHAIVLPLAAAFRLLGTNETALNLISSLYLVALLALIAGAAWSVAGLRAAAIAVVLATAVPVLSGSGSLLFSDVPEAVFVLASVLCFHRARHGPPAPWLLAAGILAGLAAITRETTVCLLAFYALLFLLASAGQRRGFAWMALGATLVVGTETLLLWAASGDPLYRMHAALRGIANDNPSLPGRLHANGSFNREGLFDVPRWIGAPLMLLANQTIGPLPWLAIPAALVVARARHRPEWRLARLLALLALIWFLGLSYALPSLFLIPRYQTVTLAALVVPLAILLSTAPPARRAPAFLCAAALAVAGATLVALSDRHVMFAERQLVRMVHDRPGTFHADPATRASADWLLVSNGDTGRVLASPPGPGDRFLFDPRPRRGFPPGWPVRAPAPEWTVLEQAIETPRLLVRLLDWAGLLRHLPAPVLQKIAPPPRELTLYQLPPE